MVLEVLSDARQIVQGGDAEPRQCGGVAYAREHQELRCLKRAGGEDHLAPAADLLDLLALAIFDADRALAVEQDQRGLRRGLDPEIAPRAEMRLDVSACSTPALAIALRDLIQSKTFLGLGIE